MDKLMDLTPVVTLVLSTLLAVLLARVMKLAKERMDGDQQEMLRTWIHIAVYAAEKLYGAGHGEEKLGYVTELLEEKGFTLDFGTLEAMVNAEIQEMMTHLGDGKTGKETGK